MTVFKPDHSSEGSPLVVTDFDVNSSSHMTLQTLAIATGVSVKQILTMTRRRVAGLDQHSQALPTQQSEDTHVQLQSLGVFADVSTVERFVAAGFPQAPTPKSFDVVRKFYNVNYDVRNMGTDVLKHIKLMLETDGRTFGCGMSETISHIAACQTKTLCNEFGPRIGSVAFRVYCMLGSQRNDYTSLLHDVRRAAYVTSGRTLHLHSSKLVATDVKTVSRDDLHRIVKCLVTVGLVRRVGKSNFIPA